MRGRCLLMNEAQEPESPGLEVRTYFVRERNALLARADFGELYVDYYLYQGQIGRQHQPQHDEMLKEALAAVTLHGASRPWNETSAWTIHFQQPLLNVFVSATNPQRAVVGQLFTENVKDNGMNLFYADIIRTGEQLRRSTVDFEGSDVFRSVERYYRQSEQRPARFFRHGEEDFVMISAQPDCDEDWLAGLDDEAVRNLDKTETLSLLEERRYDWLCGCNQKRMLDVLLPVMKSDPEGLFGDESNVRISCPRCGMKYTITRETLEAHVIQTEAGQGS